MIRVVVVDDHPVFRRGVSGLLEEQADITVVAEAATGAAALKVVLDVAPDVVLMDLHMDGGNGVDATRHIRADAPTVAVLVLTMSADDRSVRAAIEAGANGYLVKGASGERIVAAVRSVAGGETVLGADVAVALLGRLGDGFRGRAGRFPALTEREEQVLDLIARGWSNTEIARRLVVSDKTVRNHISHVFAKLDVPDRARAIVIARQAGLGTGPVPSS